MGFAWRRRDLSGLEMLCCLAQVMRCEGSGRPFERRRASCRATHGLPRAAPLIARR